MHNDGIGASIAIISAIASNLGVNIQKRSHNEEEQRPFHLQRPYTKRPFWWLGMMLIILGAFGDVFALGFSTQTLVASLGGGSTILANVAFASLWLKQELYRTDIIGVILVTIGVVICAIASVEDSHYDINDIYNLMIAPQFIFYVLCTAGFISYLLKKIKQSTIPSPRIASSSTTKLADLSSSSGKNENIHSNASRSILPMDSSSTQPIKPDHSSLLKPSNDSNGRVGTGGSTNGSNGKALTPMDDDSTITVEELNTGEGEDNKGEGKGNDENYSDNSSKITIDPQLPLYWAAVSGTMGAQSVLLAKCNMEMVFATLDGKNQFNSLGTYILIIGMIITAFAQTHTLNIATIHGDTMSVFPIFQAFWIGMSNISGIIFFQQTHLFTFTQWIMFPSALVIVMIGIYMISKHESSDQNPVQLNLSFRFKLSGRDNIEFTRLTAQDPDGLSQDDDDDDDNQHAKTKNVSAKKSIGKHLSHATDLKSMHTINLDSP